MLASLLIIIGVLLAGLATITSYANTLFYDKDVFIETVDGLIDEETLRERLIRGFSDELLSATGGGPLGTASELGLALEDGEELDDDSFAALVRREQESVIRNVVDEVVTSQSFGDVYVGALSGVHDDLLAAIDEDDENQFITTEVGEVYLDMSPLYPRIQDRLADTPVTRTLAEATLGDRAGQFKVLDRTFSIELMWDWLRRAATITPLLIFMAAASFIAAILVSDRRPWAIITAGFGVTSVSVLVIVLIYVLRAITPLMVEDRESSSLVGSVYATVVAPLVRLEVIVLVAGIAAGVVGLIARWVWPDEWIYEHHDDGTGPIAVTRRNEAEPLFAGSYGQRGPTTGGGGSRWRRKRSPQPGPQQGYPQQGHPQQQGFPQQQQPPVPAGQRALPVANPAPQAPAPPTPAPPNAAPSSEQPGSIPGWDYEGGSW